MKEPKIKAKAIVLHDDGSVTLPELSDKEKMKIGRLLFGTAWVNDNNELYFETGIYDD